MRRARALLLVVACAAAAPAGGRVPYTQTFANGTTIDWLGGESSVVGRTHIFRDLKTNPAFYKMVKKEAEEEGYTRLIAALGEAALDANTRLSEQPALLDRYRKLIDATPATQVLQDSGSMFVVRLAAPLRGERSMMSLLLPKPEDADQDAPVTTAVFRFPAGSAAPKVARARQEVKATGLVIDARHLQANDLPSPAFLPKVVDTGGRVVFGVDTADHDFARMYGMAVYQAPAPAGAREPSPGREGADPIQVMAVGARGDLRGDIVIEPESADRILKAAADAPFLEECRVLVLMPGSPRPPAVEPPGRRRGTRAQPPAKPPGQP